MRHTVVELLWNFSYTWAQPCSPHPSRLLPQQSMCIQFLDVFFALCICIKYQIMVSYSCNILCYLYSVYACDQQYHYMVAAGNMLKMWVSGKQVQIVSKRHLTLFLHWSCHWSLRHWHYPNSTYIWFAQHIRMHLPYLLGLDWWYHCCAQN